MAFGVKNRGAHTRSVYTSSEAQIGKNVDAYIDDIVVKSKNQGDLLDDLKKTFDNFHKYKMMDNPKNVCLVYHQKNCLATWYRFRGSMRT
jgi:hypothetical protein